MKQMASPYLRMNQPKGTPMRGKAGPAAKLGHLGPPLKGLSRDAALTTGDPLKASILTNWIIEEDRIAVRYGYFKIGEIAGNPPISALIPHNGGPMRLAAAAGGKLYDLNGTTVLASGYSSDNWAATAFTNLSDVDYTVMVNGADGVVSWDGTTFATETVTAPATETWIHPNKFDKVLSHMNRLWFADSQSTAVYYLPIQTKSGEVVPFPLNAIFKRGGYIMAIHTWTLDGGMGLDDKLVIFTSEGEAAIYSGTDPDVPEEFMLVGVFRFDRPLSKTCVVNYGGELYVMISSGLVPMSTLLRAESERLSKPDLNIEPEFTDVSLINSELFGWQVTINHHTNRVVCNMPLGNGKYRQLVRHMPGQDWTRWDDIPSRCWGWRGRLLHFATDDGKIYLFGPQYTNDDGKPIQADVRFAWSSFKTFGSKQFKMVRLYAITDGTPRPYIDVEVDYKAIAPTNQPEITAGVEGAEWNTATWDVDYWAGDPKAVQNWQGVASLGRVGAPRIRLAVTDCKYALTGLDVVYEEGSIL